MKLDRCFFHYLVAFRVLAYYSMIKRREFELFLEPCAVEKRPSGCALQTRAACLRDVTLTAQ